MSSGTRREGWNFRSALLLDVKEQSIERNLNEQIFSNELANRWCFHVLGFKRCDVAWYGACGLNKLRRIQGCCC
jgi:ribosome-associated toxin RatA of RatAB toxin-antitoxin module